MSPKTLRKACVVGTRDRGTGGTLSPTTPANRSGCSSGARPGHHAAEVVADDHRAFGADVIEQADDVGAQLDDVVGVDGRRLRRPAVAALIGRQHVVAGLGQRGDLVPPRIGQFGEAVGQHHHRRAAVTGLDHPQPHPVGLN